MASAQTVYVPIDPAPADWFDPATWNTGVVPTAAGTVEINSGGTVAAPSSSPNYPGSGTRIESEAIYVAGAGGVVGGPDLSGRLETDGVDTAADIFLVGFIDSPSSATNPVESPLAANGTADLGGDLLVDSFLTVGWGTGHLVQVDGGLDVAGDVFRDFDALGQAGGLVGIGAASNSGFSADPSDDVRATGVLSAGGDVAGFESINVGTTSELSVIGTVIANGSLDVAGSVETIRTSPVPGIPPGTTVEISGLLRIGVGAGQSTGIVHVGQNVTADAVVGGGARSGTSRGTLSVGGNYSGLLNAGVTALSGPSDAIGNVRIGGDADLFGFAFSSGMVNIGRSNSGTGGHAEGRVQIDGGMRSQRTVNVGKIELAGPLFPPAVPLNSVATGSLDVGGELDLGNADLLAGVARDDGSASGEVSVAGIVNARSIAIGSSRSGGTANGSLIVRNAGVAAGLAFNLPRSLSVGDAIGGNATGIADITGNVVGLDEIRIGRGRSGGVGDGLVRLRQGLLSSGLVSVAEEVDAGSSATGRLVLDRSRIEAADRFELGSNASLEIILDSDPLAAGVPTILSDAVILAGALRVDFSGSSVGSVFDLIVSGSEDGISGAFDSTAVTGLGGVSVAFSTELAQFDGRLVEVFRARVVPEPTTALLLGLSLAWISSTRPDRRQ